MAEGKITYEQFLESVALEDKDFVQNLHDFMLEKGCKSAFEAKKSGNLASYKYGKPPRAVMNFAFRKNGMLTRIYGEKASTYPEFLDSLPTEMKEAIASSGICKRLVSNTCSTKCVGYDFMMDSQNHQKCKYACFLFLTNENSKPFIKLFIANELEGRG